MIERKSISGISHTLGQYMTNKNLAFTLLDGINFSDCVVIEPSFGTGNFIDALLKKGVNDIIGCELDPNLFFQANYNFEKHNVNFYDFELKTNKKIIFVGNPPFRTPALSLRTHSNFIKDLCKKYEIKGMREEAVFFFLKCLFHLEENIAGGEIHFILPKTILTNNSKFYKRFQELLNHKFKILSTKDVSSEEFDSASLDMVFISLEYVGNNTVKHIYFNDDYWNYKEMFKRTYLGSVPCESIFLSCRGEDKNAFQQRLIKLCACEKEQLDTFLRFNGMAHLKVLNGENENLIKSKLEIIWNYLEEIRELKIEEDLMNCDNYKPIQHRKEIRYYFRLPKLKKASFVYEINPNPCESFYFTGNPSKSSTDYFGFCEYDVTRNSSPGACRTIPINVQENLQPEFKEWLGNNDVFDLILKVSKSKWYKNMKNKFNRFYFGVPKDLLLLKND